MYTKGIHTFPISFTIKPFIIGAAISTWDYENGFCIRTDRVTKTQFGYKLYGDYDATKGLSWIAIGKN